jgi:hypothetical protein
VSIFLSLLAGSAIKFICLPNRNKAVLDYLRASKYSAAAEALMQDACLEPLDDADSKKYAGEYYMRNFPAMAVRYLTRVMRWPRGVSQGCWRRSGCLLCACKRR